MSSTLPSRSFHHGSGKLFSAEGRLRPKFWTLGEKPQIGHQIPAGRDRSLQRRTPHSPVRPMGSPSLVTWTKLSTGRALHVGAPKRGW